MVTNEMFPPQERPQTGGLQGKTERAGSSSQSSAFNSYSTGDQFNTPGGTVNKSTGSGNHFPGAMFSGPVYFGTNEPFDPLQECLKSLAFLEMNSRSNDIDAAAKGTCEWLFRHEMYTSWASCDRGLLWIKGKPGSGKSTLLRYALNNVMEIPNIRESAFILSFFFHGRGADLQRTPLGLFRSLLYQLREAPGALSDLVATFQQRCETIGKPGEKWQWHQRELRGFFKSSLPKVLQTHPVWLFVDALDECGEESAVELAEEFKSLLQSLPPSGLKQFHVCFTCRHYPILDLDGVYEVCVEKENQKDISTFVQDKLSLFRKRTSSMIPELIMDRADGVFLWAWLMVKRVLDLERKGAGLKKIKAEIYSIPSELDALYSQLIQNMSPDSLKLMQWICFAVRPLSLDELRWALVIEVDCPHQSLYECQRAGDYPSDNDGMKRRVQTLSCGLAEVTLLSGDGEDDFSYLYSSSTSAVGTDATPSFRTQVVQFIHQSVKDFFVEKGLSALDETANPEFVVGMAHHRLSRICIRYLTMDEIGQSASDEPYHLQSEFPFLHYAMTSWVVHTKQSDARSVPQEDLLEYFAGPSNTLMERWICVYGILEKYSRDRPAEGTSIVHVISRYGVAGTLEDILKRAEQVGINIEAKDKEGRTPLLYAAGEGHEAVVELLVDRGADIEAADKEGWTPLLYAAMEGHEAIVELLVDRGANIEAVDKVGGMPLLYAAEGGHEAVVGLLIDRGADIEAADRCGQTPLLYAAQEGQEAVVGLLVDRGAHTEAADKEGWTPLSWAAEEGHEAVVGLLIDRGADIEAADKEGQTPLLCAAMRRHKAVVGLLSAEGHEAVVGLLIDRGADIEAADKEGRTPLLCAAMRRHKAVVGLLVDRGADIEAADKRGRTPLSWAAEEGHEAIIGLLVDRGANIEAADRYGQTPLSWAAANGHEAIVELLVDRGADIEAADKRGWTPLWCAAIRGHKAIIGLLVDRGADIEAADKEGRTPLLYAAMKGHEAIVGLLVDRGANIEAADRCGQTPLWWAAMRGHEAIVGLLVDRGANIEAADKWGRTPLLCAAMRRHKAVVELLVDRGADIKAADKRGRTPLSWAAKGGHEAIVQLLQVHIA